MTTIPIWFLDIDGVVNALEPADGLVRTTAECMGHQFTIHYSPEVVEVINAAHRAGLVEVRWLSTWEQEARTSFAPAVGLDDFAAYSIPDGDTGRWYKADVVDRVVAEEGRPFVWTDDENDLEPYGLLDAALAQHRLLLAPDPDVGLSLKNLTRIHEFLQDYRDGALPTGDQHPRRPLLFLGDGALFSRADEDSHHLFEIDDTDYAVDPHLFERIEALRTKHDLDLRWLADAPVGDLHSIAGLARMTAFRAHVDPQEVESPMSWWKGQVVVEHVVAGRVPLVWVDREIDEEVLESFASETNVLLVSPEGDRLSTDEVDRIEQFLATLGEGDH